MSYSNEELSVLDKVVMEALAWKAVKSSRFYDDVRTMPTASQRLELRKEAGSCLWFVMRTERSNGQAVKGCQLSTYPTGLTVGLQESGELEVSWTQGCAINGRYYAPGDSQAFDAHVLAVGPLGPLEG